MIPLTSDLIPDSTVQSVLQQRALCDDAADSDAHIVEVPSEIIILQNGVSSVPEEMEVRETELPFSCDDTPMQKLQIRKKGKGNALNIGIQHAKYELICVLDADCVLDEYAINTAMLHFKDESVSAVGGKLKAMSEKKNLLTFCQRVEYMKTFNIWRNLLDIFDANCLISGAYGIFRKSHILSVNGYDACTVGEDMELVLSVQQLFRPYGKSVYYEEESICYTNVPMPQLWELYLVYLGFELSVTCIAEYLEYERWRVIITKLPEAIAATAIGIMLSVPLAAAKLWGMISFPWRRLEW